MFSLISSNLFKICSQGEIWRPLPLLIFGSFALFGGIITLVLPETHNRTLPDSIEDGEKFGKYVLLFFNKQKYKTKICIFLRAVRKFCVCHVNY